MPFLVYPLVGVVAGFGAGFFAGDSSKKLLTGAAVVGGGLLAYKYLKK